MAVFPLIEYNKPNGESVTMKLPESVDLWDFLAWMDIRFMGMDPAVIAQRRADEAIAEKRLAKGRRK